MSNLNQALLMKKYNIQPPKEKEFFRRKFVVKDAQDDGQTGFLKGFLAVFSNTDLGGDVIHPGAFAKTIQEKRGVIPFLLDHNPYKPAGMTTAMKETDRGLYYEATFPLYDPEVKQRYELAKLSLALDSPMGNSIGYRCVKWDYEEVTAEDNLCYLVRNLRELQLFEGSLVTFPMNTLASVTDAKNGELLKELERLEKSGYSFEELKIALTELTSKQVSEAAPPTLDPEYFQSVETFRNLFR